MKMHARFGALPIASLAFVMAAIGSGGCGDDPQDEPVDAGPSFAGNDAGSSGSSGNPPPQDSGDPNKPTCATGFKTTGFRPPTASEIQVRPGGAEWTDLNNAFAKDGVFAKATLADGTNETSWLIVSGFGFNIPSTAETWGIEVQFVRQAPEGGIVEGRIEALVPNKVGRYKYIAKMDGSGAPANWPSKNLGTHHFGQQIDTWGYDLYPADVNTPNFKIAVYAAREAGKTGTLTAIVDSINVAIHYCEK
jgi:hypothetical protein